MNNIPYKVIRSDRKSIALVINSEAKLTIRAPYDARESEIADVIKQKKRWIAEKQKKMSALNTKHSTVNFKSGESFMYLGNTYKIAWGNNTKIDISGKNFILPKSYTKARIISWLKKQAGKFLRERAGELASVMGARFSSIRISSAKTRWGSCSGKDNLNFTWRLIMCPPEAIDYVIIHELCHITYKNHSPGFWAMVKAYRPKFKEQKSWLKNNRKLMDII